MKIGIITITDGANYGNRLQNYALQTVLRNMGHDARTIRHKTKQYSFRSLPVIAAGINLLKFFLGRETGFCRNKRLRVFEDFNKRYIRFSDETLCPDQASGGLSDKYDFFVCGSDQIWNTDYSFVREDLTDYLAAFSHPEQRVAYAASFGTDRIDPKYRDTFKKELPRFKAVSVRENSGREIIDALCGRKDTRVVLDPTMLLDADEWRKIERKPAYIKDEPFVLSYFLCGRNETLTRYIKRTASDFNAVPVDLDNEFRFDREITDRDMYLTAPEEFVWLIDHTQCVLTDSFHACVFSILFHKPFAAFQRKGSDEGGKRITGRIETLLGRFGLTGFIGNVYDPGIRPENYDIAYIEDVLRSGREDSMEFIRSGIEK